MVVNRESVAGLLACLLACEIVVTRAPEMKQMASCRSRVAEVSF